MVPISHSVSGHAVRVNLLCCSTQPLNLGAHSSNHPWGKPVSALEFLTKQLPTVLNKCTAFHRAQVSDQSRDYPSQGLIQPNSSLLQIWPGTSISLVLASPVPADVYCLCMSPTSSLFPPVTTSIQVLPCARLPSLLCSGGSW